MRSGLQLYHGQIRQIIYKEVPGQFNPTGKHGKTLSLPIFTLSLIQASSFFLELHNARSCFLFSLLSFLSMAATPKPLRQHAVYANYQPFMLKVE